MQICGLPVGGTTPKHTRCFEGAISAKDEKMFHNEDDGSNQGKSRGRN